MRRIEAACSRIPLLAIVANCAAAAIALALAAGAGPARGQERPALTASPESAAPSRDAALLAVFGLDLATVEQVEDVALLWRAVREVVLPGKVSEATQQRILRRVWAIDPEIRYGSYIDSPHH